MALVLATALSFLALYLEARFLPIPLHPMAPLLAYSALHLPLSKALWIGALAGCFHDLFASTHFGALALAFTAAVPLLFRVRKFFSFEKPLPFFLLTTVAGFLIALLTLFSLFLFDKPPSLSGKWHFIEVGVVPCFDGLYGLIWIWAPLRLFELGKRIWVRYQLVRQNADE